MAIDGDAPFPTRNPSIMCYSIGFDFMHRIKKKFKKKHEIINIEDVKMTPETENPYVKYIQQKCELSMRLQVIMQNI